MLYRFDSNSFMVVGPGDYDWQSSVAILPRDRVIGTPLARTVFQMLDEILAVFGSLLEAKMLGEEHRYEYNHQRPHSSLDDLTPAEFASRCPSPLRPPASSPKDSANQPQPQLS